MSEAQAQAAIDAFLSRSNGSPQARDHLQERLSSLGISRTVLSRLRQALQRLPTRPPQENLPVVLQGRGGRPEEAVKAIQAAGG